MSQIADDVGYVRYNASTTFTQPMYFNPTGAWNTTAANPVGGIIAQGLGGGGAAISFHRPGAFGINVGLDTDNYFRIGGWSSPPDLFQLNVVNGDVVTKGALYVSGGTGTVVATNFNGNATSATRASYLKASGTGGDMVFSWSDPGGVPNYLWGGSDGVNMRVVNINNFIRSCYNINVFQGTNTGNGYSIVGAALDNMGDGNIRLTRTYYYAPVPNPGSGGGY